MLFPMMIEDRDGRRVYQDSGIGVRRRAGVATVAARGTTATVTSRPRRPQAQYAKIPTGIIRFSFGTLFGQRRQ
jgi:hypothetical protein